MGIAEFTGYSDDALSLLSRLGGADRETFQADKALYTRELAEPTKSFVVAVTERLHDRLSPAIVGVPKVNGSISPINNDLRFNPGATPYKDHLMVRFWEGPDKKTAPTLWIRFGPDDIGFASGIAIVDLDRWRAAVGGDTGAELAGAIEALARGRDLDVAGQALKRVPKPWPPDHPRADLLRHKGLQVRWLEPLPDSVHSAAFADACVDRLLLLADVHRWLVRELA